MRRQWRCNENKIRIWMKCRWCEILEILNNNKPEIEWEWNGIHNTDWVRISNIERARKKQRQSQWNPTTERMKQRWNENKQEWSKDSVNEVKTYSQWERKKVKSRERQIILNNLIQSYYS